MGLEKELLITYL